MKSAKVHDTRLRTFQWIQLLVLSAAHFLVDLLGAILPPILPAIRAEFSLSLSLGGAILVVLSLAANWVQVLTGHTRADRSRPLLLHIGLFLAVTICLLGFLPRTNASYWLMVVLAIISGTGVAIAHPEALRAIHSLNTIAPGISTSIFMTGGFLGFASAGAVSTLLVSRFGLAGLLPLVLCPAGAVGALLLLKIRLAVEDRRLNNSQAKRPDNQVPFWLVMVMGQPAAVATTIICALVPTRLNELGFELTFGGYSSTVLASGAVVGTLAWGAIAHRKGELPCCIAAFVLTVPFLFLYLLLMAHKPAVWFLLGVGANSIPAYALIITLARAATGANLGLRMALAVGGTWGMANVIFLALVPVVERLGTGFIMDASIIGFLASAAIGAFLLMRFRPTPVLQRPRPAQPYRPVR